MKLYQLFESDHSKLYHRMSSKSYKDMMTSGELKLKRGTLCTTYDIRANSDKEFGDVQIQIDVKKLLDRQVKIVDMEYTVEWLEKNKLMKHLTGMTTPEWIKYAEGMRIDPDEELENAYGDEKEVVVFTDKLLSSEIKKL